MDAWYQCENPYPFVPQETLDLVDSVRASLPNRYCDPKVAADPNLNPHFLRAHISRPAGAPRQ